MTQFTLPLLLLKKLDQGGMTLKQACENASDELYVLNFTPKPMRVRFSGKYWQTVNDDAGTGITHGPPMAEFTVGTGQAIQVGNILGWEWDSILDADLTILHPDGSATALWYDLKRNRTKMTVADLGAVFRVDPVDYLYPAHGMDALGFWLLENEDRESRIAGAAWITRAAELGYGEAQVRLAEMMAREDAWTRYGIGHDRDEAAWWLATARNTKKTAARRMEDKGWSVVSTPSGDAHALLPVAELEFDDLSRIGAITMRALLSQTDPADWVWAMAPGGNDVSPRLRHLVLGCMGEQDALRTMRDMLAVDVETNRLRCNDAEQPILNTLCDLCDDGAVTLPDDLAGELWQRQSVMPMPTDGGPYDFSRQREDFAADHEKLARRPTRGEPIPIPVNPLPGWYAETLGHQPNATIRAVLAGTGERALCCYLSGCSPFTRFQFWQVSSAMVRGRLVDADEDFRIGDDDRAEGRAEMDALLRNWHRAGKIRWWS